MINKNSFFDISQTVRALSWKQPYGSLMLPPHNKIETRIWNTKYRGLVLICASKALYSPHVIMAIAGQKQYDRIWKAIKDGQDMHCGQAIGIGELVDCRPMLPSDSNDCFVNFNSDLYCHVYKNVRPIQSFDWKGKQGWKTLSVEEKRKIILLNTTL